jgi:hypothetical protein
VNAYEFSHALSSARARLSRRTHCGDVATNDRSDKATADLLVTNQFNASRFNHCVGGFHHPYKAAGFDHAKGISHAFFSSMSAGA